MTSHAMDPELLLEHLDWVRELSRRLVRDPGLAEDLSQDTWLAALSSPLPAAGSVRGWLAKVARNVARQRHRRDARRRELEVLAARAGTLPATLDVVAGVSLQKKVVECVLALREPYRRTLLARYYERMSVSAIAEREGVSSAAVKARLSRALAELRRQLADEVEGDPRLALLALFPRREQLELVAPAKPVLAPALAAAGVLAVLGALAVWALHPTTAGEPIAIESITPALDQGDDALAGTAPRVREPLAVSAAPVHPATRPEAGASPASRVDARVLDVEGRPVADVPLVLFTGSPCPRKLGRTHADGTLSFEAPEDRGRLTLSCVDWVPLYEPYVVAEEDEERLLVVDRACPLSGTVRDTTGQPLSGAKVTFELDRDLMVDLDVFGRGLQQSPYTYTDAYGHFLLERMPCTEEGRLVVGHHGHHVLRRPLTSRAELELVLTPLAPEKRVVNGVVRDPEGYPVDDAYVTAGGRAVRTDGCGRWQLNLDIDGPPVEMVAAAPGRLPSRVMYMAPFSGEQDFVLRSDEALALEGRIVDEDGRPVADALVQPLDPSPFGRVHANSTVEEVSLERMLTGDRDVEWVRTDAHGLFRLEGLLPRAYALRVYSTRAQTETVTEPYPAGSGSVEIRVRSGNASVGGTVVDERGEPVAGTRVRALRVRGDTTEWDAFTPALVTGADGTFRFESIDASHLAFEVSGPAGHLLDRRRLDRTRPLDDQRLVAARSAQLRVVLADVHRADEFALYDSNGRHVHLVRFQGFAPRFHARGAFGEDGRSPVYLVPRDVTSLVLLRDGAPVARHDVQLGPARVTRVEL